MSGRMIEDLNDRISKKRSHIEMLADRAVDEHRDLNDDELKTIDSLNGEITTAKRQLDVLLVDTEVSEEAQSRIRSVVGGVTTSPTRYRSAGEMLWDCLHQSDQQARQRYQRVMRRAAEHMGTESTTTTATAGDLGGLVVKPLVGPVVDPYPKGMPFANVVGMQDIPTSDGFGFSRPRIIDANFTTGGVAQQSLEKAELVSKKFDIDVDNVALKTYGGYLNVSQQLISFQAASLQIIVNQLRRRLEYQIDKAVLTEAQLSTGKVTLATGTVTAAVLMKAIYDAAAAYYAVTFSLPEWLAMGPLGWARLGGTCDTAGRPLFPTLGATNAPGSAGANTFALTVAGLTPVVTPGITDDSYWVGGPDALEGYLYRFPVLEAVEPSVLGRQVALAASMAGFRPTPFANALIHLAP